MGCDTEITQTVTHKKEGYFFDKPGVNRPRLINFEGVQNCSPLLGKVSLLNF